MRPALSWVVQPGDGACVGDVLAHLSEPHQARRVFLNGRPCAPADAIEPGDRVDIYPRREPKPGPLTVLGQRDGIVVVDKPAGLASETTRQGEDSVVSLLVAMQRGGHVHAMSRLDALVSGAMLCTLGRDASRRVAGLRERGQIRRTYLAIVSGALPDEGEWNVPLGRPRGAVRGRVGAAGADARPATSRFRVLARARGLLLELTPVTGRTHQLRAHCALAGAPIFGDRLYRGPTSAACANGRVIAVPRIALHCARVELPDLGASAPVPEELRALWRDLGGADADWPGDARP